MLKKIFWTVFKLDTSKHRQYTLLYDDLCMQSNAYADMLEVVDNSNLKFGGLWPCGFESHCPHQNLIETEKDVYNTLCINL